MFIDENFDIKDIDQSLFDLVKTKFSIVCRRKLINRETTEDMMQDWFLRKLRLGKTNFIETCPSTYFKKAEYKYSMISGDNKESGDFNIFNLIESSLTNSEASCEISTLYDLMVESFNEVTTAIFFDKKVGFTLNELAEFHNVDVNKIRRDIKGVEIWLQEQVA